MTEPERYADMLDTAAARARERSKWLARRGEGQAMQHYQLGRAAVLEQLAELTRAVEAGRNAQALAILAELRTPPTFQGGPPHHDHHERPYDAAHGLTA